MSHAARENRQKTAAALPSPGRFRGKQLASAAFCLALALAAGQASADVIGAGEKRVKATYELVGLDRYPEYLFVAFPYGGCPMWPDNEYYAMNPERNVAWQNYEVLKSGRRYEPSKFCSTRIYAFKASEFPTEERTLTRQLDFYRLEGYVLTIVKGFDELKTTDKMRFVERSRSVTPSSININFSTLVPETVPFTSTHDVLRIAEITGSEVRFEGIKIVAGTEGGKLVELPYKEGRRPTEVGEHALKLPPPYEQIPDDEAALILAGMGALAVFAFGFALVKQVRSDRKKSGSS